MAFNFNWSPLTADAEFYQRARDLLTTALNKSPKPPIIVDDILVTEFNLGSIPPELEILEIGDLAEDRFRGIFKMCYSGDAFLTLKTRVQVRLQRDLVDRGTLLRPSFWSAISQRYALCRRLGAPCVYLALYLMFHGVETTLGDIVYPEINPFKPLFMNTQHITAQGFK